ncbi:hypothetical protein SDC9_185993 [bioreactor metagenome]|uniref:Uncharacterized protein n=1 Tax=bioreactor metagenome TaxID=1076179 RepID=A0A645HJU9_9ZZZZ
MNLTRVTARVIGMPDLHNRTRHRLAAIVDHTDLHMQRQAIPAIADIHALGRQRVAGAYGGLAGKAATARQPGGSKRIDAAHGSGDGLGAAAEPGSSGLRRAGRGRRCCRTDCGGRGTTGQWHEGQCPQQGCGLPQPASARGCARGRYKRFG